MFDRLFLFLFVVYCPRGGLCGSRAVAGRELEGEHFEGDIAMRERLPGGSHGAMLAALWDSSKRWPGGRVPYRIDTNSIPNAEHHQIIRDAMDQISRKVTCVQFEDNEKLANPKLDFIRIAADGDAKNSALGCWSYLGMIGGEQTLNLDGNCFRVDLIIHELLHALSFVHEQNRSDRDDFVEIQQENIQPGMESQFIKRNEDEVDEQNTPYDFRSRLHYPPKAFSKSGEDTIVALYPGNDNFGPVDTGLSPIDIVEISLLYDCPVKNSDIIEYIHQNRLANEMRIEILDENNYEEFNDIKACLNDTEEELNSMKMDIEDIKKRHTEDINNIKEKFSEDLNKMKSQILADITSKSPKPEHAKLAVADITSKSPKPAVTEYFGACVDSWCRQSGTSDQFTKCESVRDGGLTCVNPEVRYGSTEGGIPCKESRKNYDAWCQQLLGFGTNSRVTYGARDCAAPKGRLWWGAGYDEPGAKWCDLGDGYWKDASLDYHIGCDIRGITSLTCSK